MKKKILSIGVSALLSISTFLTLIPQTATTVYADNYKKISGLCTGSIINPTGAGQWCYVYYGNKIGDNYVRYRVLDKAATEYGGNTMLLDCDYLLEKKRFDDDSNIWANSEIKGYLNAGFLTNKFDAREQAAIAASKKNTASSKDGNGWKSGDTDYLPWTPLVSGDNDETSKTYIFLLDAKEATSTSYGYENSSTSSPSRQKYLIGTTSDDWWWLRSPYSSDTHGAGHVYDSGSFNSSYVYNGNRWLSPAFNINLSSVIFSSVISDGYKLTVKDENMTIAKTDGSDVTRAGNVVTVPYTISGTNSGNATQVSVLLTNSVYVAGETKTTGYSYQKLNVTAWGTSGTGTFTIPDSYADKTCGTDYYAYILAEDVNDGTATDYASIPVAITIPTEPVPVTGVTVSPKDVELKPGYTKLLTATVKPDDATNRRVKWSSNKESVAKVGENDGLVTAIAEGEATITATTVDGGKTDTCKVIVKKDAPVVEECRITFDPNGGKGKMAPQVADKGETVKLKANDFTRSGYEFKNWNTKADGSGDKYDNKASIKLEKDMTLYAQWKEKHEDDDDDDDDNHDDSPSPSNQNNTRVPDGCDELRSQISNAIESALKSSAVSSGGKAVTVYWNKGTSLPADVMKTLHDNPNVTLVFSYTYQGVPITLTIPGSAVVLNPAVEWYGPAYLYALYGKGTTAALTTNTTASTGTYTIKSGDTLSGIAKRLNTTLKHLKDANNIKDADKIKPGMVLKY